MDYIIHELTSPGVILGAANIAQNAVYHGRVKSLERTMHQDEINLMRQNQRDEMGYVKKTYIMSSIHDMERHFQQLNSDLLDGTKEFEKDMVDQRNLWSQTIILAATIMILATISVLVQGILPNKSSEHPPNDDVVANRLYFSYSVSNAGSMAFLFVTIVIYVEIVARISKFSIERASQHAKNLKTAMFETQSLLDRLMPKETTTRRQQMMDNFSSSSNYNSYQNQPSSLSSYYGVNNDRKYTDEYDNDDGEGEEIIHTSSFDADDDIFYDSYDNTENQKNLYDHAYDNNDEDDEMEEKEEYRENDDEDDDDNDDVGYLFTPRGNYPTSDLDNTKQSSSSSILHSNNINNNTSRTGRNQFRQNINNFQSIAVANARSVSPTTAASRQRTFETPEAYPATTTGTNRYQYGSMGPAYENTNRNTDDHDLESIASETDRLLPISRLERNTSTHSKASSRVPFSTTNSTRSAYSSSQSVLVAPLRLPGTPPRPDTSIPTPTSTSDPRPRARPRNYRQTSNTGRVSEIDAGDAGLSRYNSTMTFRERDAQGNLIHRPPTRKPVALMDDIQTNKLFNDHEEGILRVYLQERDKITLDMMKSYSLKNSFNKYWQRNCEHLDQWGIKLFYIGTTLM